MQYLNLKNATIKWLIRANIIFFIIFNTSSFIIHPEKPDGYLFAMMGIFAVLGVHLGSSCTEVFYLLSGIFYTRIAFEYSLIGEGLSQLLLTIPFNAYMAYKCLIKKGCNENSNNHIENNRRSFIAPFFAVFISCAIFFYLERFLSLFNSIYSDWEAFNFIIIFYASYFMVKRKSIQWIFWFIRDISMIYIWFYIDDRAHVESLWIFYTINALLNILHYSINRFDDNYEPM